MTESNGQNTPFSILATELLVDILSLTHPRSSIPATSAVTKSIALDDLHLARSWTHHIIFHSNHLAEIEAKIQSIESDFFDYDPAARQLASRLSAYLKSRLADCGNQLAPVAAPNAQDVDVVLTESYIDWLFCTHGPFRADMRRNPTSWQAQLDTLCGPLYADDAADHYPFEHPDRLKALTHRRWQLGPDAFQLVMYFARSGHVHLLQRTLAHLHDLLPDLATSTLPMSRWCQVMLDTRPHVRRALNLVTDLNSDTHLPFPVLVGFVGALDWSLPVISAAGAGTQFTAWINTCQGAFRAMFDTLGAVKDADRAVGVLEWMYANGLEKWQVDVEDADTDSPFMAPCACNAQVFGALLRGFDVSRVLPMYSVASEGVDAVDAEYMRMCCERLGESIEWWVGKGEDDWELVEVGLENGLFAKPTLAKLLLKAAGDANQSVQARIVEHVRQSERLDIRDVVYTALTIDLNAHPPSVCATLRSLIRDPVDERTHYLLANLNSWTDAELAPLVFDSDPPFSPTDHAKFVTAWLHKIMDKQFTMAMIICQSKVLSRVFALALAELDLAALPIEALALGASLCAIVLGSASVNPGRENLSEIQWGVLDAIAVKCRETVECKRVACSVSETGVRELKPAAVEYLRMVGEVLDRFGQGIIEHEVSVNRLLFDFGLVLHALGENDLLGT